MIATIASNDTISGRSMDGLFAARATDNRSFAACSTIDKALPVRLIVGVRSMGGAIDSSGAIDQRNTINARLAIVHRDVINVGV